MVDTAGATPRSRFSGYSTSQLVPASGVDSDTCTLGHLYSNPIIIPALFKATLPRDRVARGVLVWH